ncbi:MAG: hypothetical protein JWP11_1316 [Frankiales bacterium]|nr:hypothetical protein [Frankiales bacterium]
MRRTGFALSALAGEALGTVLAIWTEDPYALEFALLTIALAVLVLAAVLSELPSVAVIHANEAMDKRITASIDRYISRSS